MPEIRHVTTRRGFITGMGFGAVGLYGVWAAYGAAPLPFGNSPQGLHQGHGDSHEGLHEGHGGAPEAAGQAEAGHGGGTMSPEAFRREHAAFIERFKRPDGSVEPVAAPAGQQGMDHHAMSHHEMSHHEMTGHEMAGHEMPGHEMSHHEMAPGAAGNGGPAPEVDLYLLAFKWGYNPEVLRLRTGTRYRLRLMADDVTHGASLQLGSASRIIRLRPNVVGEQSLTFTKPGTVLVYCSVYCGQGHDMMQGKIIVSDPDRGGQS